jgi:hypothetical protein
MRTAVLLVLLLPAFAGCSRPTTGAFSDQHARAHLEMLAGTIGSRPVGTAANARARAYVIDQLRIFGYDVRVQEVDARRAEIGRTARVSNIIATLPGERREALGLVSHYDSRADTPGAGDDAFGVAVSLEAARVIASITPRRWTTMILVTDAEEEGLMGAAALMNDPQVRDALAAYINLESTGSSGPAMLFQTGPGNDWLVRSWARHAPRPRGGSFAIEIYNRLPNDTDFSVLRRHDIPGLNIALVGNSHVYHTSRDTPARVDLRAVRETGENVVAIAAALQGTDITARSSREGTYFDLGGTVALSYGPLASWILSGVALIAGLLAWLRVTRFLIREEGVGSWLLGLIWALLGTAMAVAAMVGATALLRIGREVYHPWYAHPDRLLLLLASVGGAIGWMMARAGRWIPARAKGLRHPAVAWTSALPLWIALALLTTWTAPAASYLWTVPLLAAGLVLLVVPLASLPVTRAASVIVLGVAATFWLRDTVELFRFLTAVLGRMPFVTPVFAHAALVALAGLMILPPMFAAFTSTRALLRPALMTAVLLGLVAIAAIRAWVAPAYTEEHPLRASVRVVQEQGAATSLWQLGALEPGVALAPEAPMGWTPVAVGASLPWGRLPQPFVFSTTSAPLPPAPVTLPTFIVEPLSTGGTRVRIAAVPGQPGLTVSFLLPQALAPDRSNLPGIVRGGRWSATFIALPPEGIAWEASFAAASEEGLRALRVAVTAEGIPGGSGPQRLPAWVSGDRSAWTAYTSWIVDPAIRTPTPEASANERRE